MRNALRVTVWLRALRAPFFVGTLTPAAFGAAYAHFAGYPFNWGLFWLTMIGTALANAGCNLANDYFDYQSGDDQLTRATPFSGGSKVIQEGLLSPRQVRNASITSLVLCAGIGLYLNAVTGGLVILAIGIIGREPSQAVAAYHRRRATGASRPRIERQCGRNVARLERPTAAHH